MLFYRRMSRTWGGGRGLEKLRNARSDSEPDRHGNNNGGRSRVSRGKIEYDDGDARRRDKTNLYGEREMETSQEV